MEEYVSAFYSLIRSLISYVHSSPHPAPGNHVIYQKDAIGVDYMFRRPNEWEYVHDFLNFYKVSERHGNEVMS